MACMICKGSSCIPSFHSLEEQSFFNKAETAYEKYLEVLQECREDYLNYYAPEEILPEKESE